MNKVILMGNLTRDPEIRYTQASNGESLCISRYSLAVNRPPRGNGQKETDFFNCVAFGRNGEFAEKYLRKGMQMIVCGRIQPGSYTNRDGQKVNTMDIIVEEHYFGERKAGSSGQAYQQSNQNYQQGGQNYQQGGQNYQQGRQNYQPYGSAQPEHPSQAPYGVPQQSYAASQPAQAPQPSYGVPQQPYGAPVPSQASGYESGNPMEGFMNIPDGIDDELPFN